MKNPFKKSNIVDTLVNVGVGGAANVAFDYVADQIDAVASLESTTKNAVKIALGAVAGSMISNKYLRAAADGIATVGVSNLVAGYMGTEESGSNSGSSVSPATGLPNGTIGRLSMGQRGFARRAKALRGVGKADFMGC